MHFKQGITERLIVILVLLNRLVKLIKGMSGKEIKYLNNKPETYRISLLVGKQ